MRLTKDKLPAKVQQDLSAAGIRGLTPKIWGAHKSHKFGMQHIDVLQLNPVGRRHIAEGQYWPSLCEVTAADHESVVS